MPNLTLEERTMFTQAIAFFLNVGEKSAIWEPKPIDPNDNFPTQYIVKAGDPTCEFGVHYDTPTGKVDINGNYHFSVNGSSKEWIDVREWDGSQRVPLPSMSASIARGPEAIAKDIKRRFLGEYLRMHAKAVETVNSRIDYRTKQVATMRELAAIVDLAPSKLQRAIDEQGQGFTFYDGDKGYGDVQVFSDSINLKLSSLSLDKARRILKIMAE